MTRLKPIMDQVIVITGASSGIGLATARRAAEAGACVVLAARNERALRSVVEDLTARGARAICVVADVGELADVRRIADAALKQWGRIDTWVNNAGVTIYGELQATPLEDHRRLFETNYWGTVHGSLVALEHLEEDGGALINVGSVYSDAAVPLQAAYCASKHAQKAFTDGVRMELEARGAPVSVTYVKPSAIDTPSAKHAGNFLGVEARNPEPAYAPETVARAILRAAAHPVRDVYVGATGRLLHSLQHWAPRLMDRALELFIPAWTRTDRPAAGDRHGTLFRPEDDGGPQERSHRQRVVLEHSAYTAAALHPVATAALLAVGGAAALALLRPRRG